MSVSDPADVLAELQAIAEGYRGVRRWTDARSNPIKLRSRYDASPQTVHPEPRVALSAREGAALIYALDRQSVDARADAVFSRYFRHRDGRQLVIENGVFRDLLKLGAISYGSRRADHELVLTASGVADLAANFPGRFE